MAKLTDKLRESQKHSEICPFQNSSSQANKILNKQLENYNFTEIIQNHNSEKQFNFTTKYYSDTDLTNLSFP